MVSESKILVVDDDDAVRRLLVRFLGQEKYQIQEANNGQVALAIFEKFQPHLVILDVNLPDMLGYDLCYQMQSRTNVMILMLTSRTNLEDKQQGFFKGADDYVTKPFDLTELAWRVKALLRRQRELVPDTQPALQVGNFIIDLERREFFVNNLPVYLTALEFDLIYCMARHPGRVWNRKELIETVWGEVYDGDSRLVDVHIGQIRKKISSQSPDTQGIQTVRGVGYRFDV
jgi:two-component system OmpR family response regulator